MVLSTNGNYTTNKTATKTQKLKQTITVSRYPKQQKGGHNNFSQITFCEGQYYYSIDDFG